MKHVDEFKRRLWTVINFLIKLLAVSCIIILIGYLIMSGYLKAFFEIEIVQKIIITVLEIAVIISLTMLIISMINALYLILKWLIEPLFNKIKENKEEE